MDDKEPGRGREEPRKELWKVGEDKKEERKGEEEGEEQNQGKLKKMWGLEKLLRRQETQV